MKKQNKWESLFEDFLDVTDFKLVKHSDGWGLYDRQYANLGGIEEDRFEGAADIFDRMDVYINDSFYADLEDELDAYGVDMEDREIPEGADEWIDLRSDKEFCEKYPEYIDNHSFEFNVLEMIVYHANEIDLENVEYENNAKTMKCKVRLTRTVELFVEGKGEETIMDWLRGTTPEEAYQLADGGADDSYDEEIVCWVREDSDVDYVIKED